MSLALTKKIPYLKDRARMMQVARAFFHERNILEVDAPALVKHPPNDANIDVIQAGDHFLHTSPEYAMKRLLSAGFPDCYFLGHVYRKGEIGRRHNPEFTMAEWYRIGFSFEQMIQETADFLSLFLGPQKLELLSYHEAFQRYSGSIPENTSWDHATRMHYILTHHVEPHLGLNGLTALIDFPVEEAALAITKQKQGHLVAERFEIYFKGVELANGYHELADAIELRRRFEEINKNRIDPYPIDESFLDAMQTFPACCGVAVGFDRAFMLSCRTDSLESVLAFPW